MIKPTQPGRMNGIPERSRTGGLTPIEGIHDIVPRIDRIQIPGKRNASTMRIDEFEFTKKKTVKAVSLQKPLEFNNRRVLHNSQA